MHTVQNVITIYSNPTMTSVHARFLPILTITDYKYTKHIDELCKVTASQCGTKINVLPYKLNFTLTTKQGVSKFAKTKPAQLIETLVTSNYPKLNN